MYFPMMRNIFDSDKRNHSSYCLNSGRDNVHFGSSIATKFSLSVTFFVRSEVEIFFASV